jgi:hypothetical protein
MTCLLLALSETSSVSSMASLCDALCLTLPRVLGNFKLSLDECIEFIILGLITIVVHGLLSLHHLEKFGNLLLQHLQQQQHKKIITKLVVTIRTYDKNDK